MDLAVQHQDRHANTDAAVVAIENALGLSPGAPDASVRARLDRIDAKMTNWTAYTPQLFGTGWALGTTGSQALGAYCVTNSVVHFWARLLTGTGATFGTAAPQVSLPFPVNTDQRTYSTDNSTVGFVEDVSALVSYRCVGRLTASTTAQMRVNVVSGTYETTLDVSNTVPFTWVVGDYLGLSGWYRKA